MTEHKAPFCSLLFVAPDDLCGVGVANVVYHLFVVRQRLVGHRLDVVYIEGLDSVPEHVDLALVAGDLGAEFLQKQLSYFTRSYKR